MTSTFSHPIDPLLATGSGLGESRGPRPAVRASMVRPSAATFRRRRLVSATVAVFALVTVFFATNALATDPSSDVPPAPRTMVARPGDTIWGIARSLAPTGDITELVEALILTNGSQIEAGQVVRIP